MTEHVSHKRALYVVSLAESDPVRRKAHAHAETCVRCAHELRVSAQLLELIDRSAKPAVVDAQLTARVKQAVFADAPRKELVRDRWLRGVQLWAARWLFGDAARSAHVSGRVREHTAGVRWILLLLGGALSLLIAWVDTQPGPWFGSEHGLHCVLFENAYALAACAAAAVWARTRKRALDPWTGSIVGMSGALFGQMLLRTHCDSAHAALHLLAFHALGVLFGTALGALATPAFTRPR